MNIRTRPPWSENPLVGSACFGSMDNSRGVCWAKLRLLKRSRLRHVSRRRFVRATRRRPNRSRRSEPESYMWSDQWWMSLAQSTPSKGIIQRSSWKIASLAGLFLGMAETGLLDQSALVALWKALGVRVSSIAASILFKIDGNLSWNFSSLPCFPKLKQLESHG